MQAVTDLGIAAFADLPDAVVADLNRAMHLRPIHEGALLYRQGDAPDTVFFLHTGRVKWHLVNEDGSEQTLMVVEPGDPIGLVALLDRRPCIASATALEESTVWDISLDDFDRLLQRHPELALRVMRHLGEQVRGLMERLNALSARSAHERVSSILLQRAQPAESGVQVIPMTHQQIAHMSGMARETVSRVLADFQRRGAVRLTRSAVILLDPSRFRSGRGGRSGSEERPRLSLSHA